MNEIGLWEYVLIMISPIPMLWFFYLALIGAQRMRRDR
jgi:hypothetical protein